MTRKLSWLVIVVLLLTAVPVLAGGWAVVTMDDVPTDIHAGEPTEFNFMVRQHGETPVHFLGGEEFPVEPLLTAVNQETGETVEVEAIRGKEVGRFTSEVIFPSEGTWEWTISPDPLGGEGVFPPLTVMAPVAASTALKEAVEQPAAATQIEAAPAVQESAAPSTTTVTTTTAEPILRSGLQWAAVALLVVAIALLLIQRRSASASKLGTLGSGD